MAESLSERISTLKARVGDQWLDLLRTLAPDLEEACDEFPEHVPCPMHGGSNGLRLFNDAETTGGGVCNTCGAFSDGIALLQEVNGWTFTETVQKIEEWLNDDNSELEDDEEETSRRSTRRVSPRPEEQETNQSVLDYIEDISERAESCHERIIAYYRHRGLSVAPSEYLGYLPEVEYYDKENGNLTLPAMLGILVNGEDEMVGVFRTYLDPDSDGKAPVTHPKKFMKPIRKGATMGAAIRLHDLDGDVLAVAEGVETAEAVFQDTGTPTWATCTANGMKTFIIPRGVRELQVWADNDTSKTGQQAAAKLARRAVEQGLVVKVMLPPEPDTDWLDVLVAQGEGVLRQALENAEMFDPSVPTTVPDAPHRQASAHSFGEAPQGTGDPVPQLNKRHFVVAIGGKVFVATETTDPNTGYPTVEFGNERDFALRYANRVEQIGKEKVPAARLWLTSAHRREYEGVVFSPGKNIPNYYNLWKGFAVQPRRGDCGLFWQHVRDVICAGDTAHYTYLRKWLAHMIQRPDELPGVAIVIRGSQGVGKTFFADQVGKLLGPHYLMLTRMEQLTGRFTGHLKDALLVCANEAVWGGDKQGEGALKSMITDPNCTIEQKGKDLFQVRNYKRLIVTTNEQWAVPMAMQDRRFLILEPSEAHREDKPYFAALAKQMREGGLQALLYDLQHEDLSDFDVRTKPRSSHGFDIQLRSSDPVVRWWYECLHRGTHDCPEDDLAEDAWNREPDKDSLHTAFLAYCSSHRLRTIDKPLFGKELRKMLPGHTVGETRPRTGDSRSRCYTLPTLQECREAFQRFAKAGPDIWADAAIDG